MAASTYHLLNAETPVFRLDSCSGNGRLLCEFGNWLSTAIPDPLQIWLELASGIFLTMLALYGAVRLMWPRRANVSSGNSK